MTLSEVINLDRTNRKLYFTAEGVGTVSINNGPSNNVYRQTEEPKWCKEKDVWYKPVTIDGIEQHELNIYNGEEWLPY